MRKFLKNSILEIFQTMYEAHISIKKMIDKKDFENVSVLLEDCQNTAVQIGTSIESSEGEGFVTVGYLEEYCEAVYEVATSISDEYSGNKAQKTLDKKLIKAENSVKNDVKVRPEIVFCPYKASMWDSLESVWKAADEDPDCDAYVVPIPYYDRNPDYTFGEFHYEGGDYPDYVPITHYEAYDFEARRPDVVYIHNPYDDCNYVTSVDPRFYSSELKKYTACLIYIPYCVYDEGNSLRSIDYCKHYVTPAIINSDKVILQSDVFRNAIINTLMTFDARREYWKNKILSMGSPKYDKIIQLEGKLSNIPDDWKKVIYKSDGTKKKVIFYNTSLGSLLKDAEQMLKKIESVINYFYEIKNEFVMLWRPHPLMKATIDSMRSELSEKYSKIVDDFIAGGWGIFDDTPSYDMAFALSDAYYGDYSSLVQLYQATGKPLIMQCAEVTDYSKGIVTDYMYYDGQYIWLTAKNFNGLYKMDAVTYKVDFAGKFPDEDADGYWLYHGIAECNGKLYFAPYKAENIAIYDKNTCTFKKIPLRNDFLKIKNKFNIILKCNKYIFLSGFGTHTMIRIDTDTDEIIYFDDFFGNNDCSSHVVSSCVHNDKLYFYSSKKSDLVCLDPNDMSIVRISMNDVDKNRVIFGNGLLMLKLLSGKYALFDFEKQELTEVSDLNDIAYFYELGDYIYSFSSTEKSVTRIHKCTLETMKFPLEIYAKWCCETDNKLLIYGYDTDNLCLFDTESLAVSYAEFDCTLFPKTDPTKMLKSNQNYNRYAKENSFFNLEDMIEIVKAGKYKAACSKDVCGNKIHKFVKGLIL